MRLTTRTNLATRLLMACAANPGATLRTADVAVSCNASLNHLLQVGHALQAGGFLVAIRGRSGGVKLSRPAGQISMGAMFRLFEAGTPFAECFDAKTNTCPLMSVCRLRTYIALAVEAFYHELDMVTLADLVQGNCGLTALLQAAPNLQLACAKAPAG